MSVAGQLFQLQELDLEIESKERARQQKESQLGENQVVVTAEEKLAQEQKRLKDLQHQQRSAEWEINDLDTKIAVVEKQLYDGKITNPKELTNLQHEVETLKVQRDQLETKALEVLERVEVAEASVVAASDEFKQVEDGWQRQQRQLADDISQLKSELSEIRGKRQQLSDETDPEAVEFYEGLRQQKVEVVAKVDQGICRGCRISLPFSDLQRARSGSLVRCSSCGRILFSP